MSGSRAWGRGVWEDPSTTLLTGVFDGQEWEVRIDGEACALAYASHISCSHSKVKSDTYARLWSWELHDAMDKEAGVNRCHYCHIPVPDGVQAVVVLYKYEDNL